MKRTYLTLIIIMLVIGFAAVTTNLVINGNINIGFNEDEFNVYFSYARIDTTESDKIISSDKQNIIFTTNKLTDINQSSTLYYEVTNSSKQYDANVEVTCDEGTELYSIDNTLNDTTIKARSVSKGKVIVTLNKISTEEKEIEFECRLNVTAISKVKKRIKKYQRYVIMMKDLNGTLIIQEENKNLQSHVTEHINLKYGVLKVVLAVIL